MSPPCQPFTRNGNQKDIADTRSDALNHICEILPNLIGIDYILMENVKAFQTSTARHIYTETLSSSGFYYQEFILSPSQFGIPNTRYRYYCIARRCKEFPFKSNEILLELPATVINSDTKYGSKIADYLSNKTNDPRMHVPDKILSRYAWQFDIVHPESMNSICFTKAYTHYVDGTGSIFCPCAKLLVQQTFDKLKLDPTLETVNELKKLDLQYFTPLEVAKLMCFPISDDDDDENVVEKCDKFSFPKLTTNRQRYRLLGNSINVYVVSELIKLLLI